MIEFNLFLIDYWYFSFPLFLTIILWSRHEMNRGGNKITSADLTRLVNKNSATVIDLRSADEFNIGHIANSINMPHDAFEKYSHRISSDRQKPIILVCSMGSQSKNIGETLKNMEYANINILQGGILTWQQEGLPLVTE
ncbi:MAG: rhodanese-like domain-containing protein [SAR86 cluster bacterium]|jgi:rhodanese-related sulfurtransferase|uniref:Rhodanese-like domain-containing protein n=1 Tax=SAR86 cluster bacterium TaxID=2030880 RepID=A0A937J743_9GAMM|nr:rhodanese-like domain-containing protein [SAR86 cluster bacterium]MDG1203321.1 rhodanese-like domain-containing protein [SAR86 cluster bacterium]MDG1721640.1 rhodanese-like domain-containing protein [SAR86 cluster bacterium]|tara:strand:- start:6840 stop:7256 length:417 start_codon:yes stop_codon:yes gene_type:complete